MKQKHSVGKVCEKHSELQGARLWGDCPSCGAERRAEFRAQKKAQGGVYFGRVCEKHPELNGRRNPNSTCVSCSVERIKARRGDNTAGARDKARAYAATPERRAAQKVIKSRRTAEINADTARRRATKRLATPAWANEFFIQEAYSLAKLREKVCGGAWHVDHIVPLKSALVCGLHVEHNLQVIPAALNAAKHNRYWPHMP